MVYLTAIRGSENLDVPAFVELAMRVLEALGATCTAAGAYQEKARGGQGWECAVRWDGWDRG